MVEMYKIIGGNSLTGKIKLCGAKNAALPILAGTVLTDDEVVLNNVPVQFNDVKVMLNILEALGKKVIVDGNRAWISGPLKTDRVPADLGNKIRYSLLFLGALLNRLGKTCVPNPGGCNIGDRKFDLHLFGLEALGAEFQLSNVIEGRAEKLLGKEISLYLPTTSGTQNIVFGALGATGTTLIKNANTRPENLNFAKFLQSMGAKIEMGNRIAKISGPCKLHGTEFSIMNGPDELVSYLIAAAVTKGEIQIENASLEFIPTDVKLLRECGLEIFEWGDSVFVSSKKPLKPINIFTTPYPGINSDLQPLYSVLGSTIEGESTVTDMRFTERFQYVEELKKFGVNIEVYGNCAVIHGGEKLHGCDAKAMDLRGGAAVVLAGLCAEGPTTVDNIYQIERGYANLPETLKSLGANIEIV